MGDSGTMTSSAGDKTDLKGNTAQDNAVTARRQEMVMDN
jgi:hypothetical protein